MPSARRFVSASSAWVIAVRRECFLAATGGPRGRWQPGVGALHAPLDCIARSILPRWLIVAPREEQPSTVSDRCHGGCTRSERLASVLDDPTLHERASAVGAQLEAEDGVAAALSVIT